MKRVLLALSLAVLGAVTVTNAMTPTTPAVARARVEHHLRQIEPLVSHFQALLRGDCPRFATPDAWDAYVDSETDRLILLMAHLEQAWLEAKRTGDDDVRRAAKAPRRQTEQARQLIGKLQACAELNGATFAPLVVWQRVEREVPRRQTEIALPE